MTDSKRVDVISMIVAATREIGEDLGVFAGLLEYLLLGRAL